MSPSGESPRTKLRDGHVAWDGHVAIVGGGIGGLGLALALQKAGLACTVITQKSRPRVHGKKPASRAKKPSSPR